MIMATDPERPIEKLLRDAAKKRREEQGAEFTLSPMTRRLLQGEVARTFATKKKAEPVRWYQRLFSAGPRFAWGLSLGLLLLVAGSTIVVWWTRPSESERFAMSRSRSAAGESSYAPAASHSTAPAPLLASGEDKRSPIAPIEQAKATREYSNLSSLAAAGQTQAPVTLALDDGRLALSRDKDKSAVQQRLTESVSPPAGPATASAPPLSLSGPAPAAANGDLAANNPAGTAAPAAAPASVPPSTVPGSPTDGLAANSPASGALQPDTVFNRRLTGSSAASRFRLKSDEVSPEQPPAAATPPFDAAPALDAGSAQLFIQPNAVRPVLASFQLEHSGENVRIIDRDGSVYTGYVETPPSVQRTYRAIAQSVAPTEGFGRKMQAATNNVAPSYFFRVAGTNRSLKENVVFTGNLLTDAELSRSNWSTNSPGTAGQIGGAMFYKAPAQKSPSAIPQTRVAGKARIGDSAEIEINAIRKNP